MLIEGILNKENNYVTWHERDDNEVFKRFYASILSYIDLDFFEDGSEVIADVDIDKMYVTCLTKVTPVKDIRNNFKDYYLSL